jgi:hypothetical protein
MAKLRYTGSHAVELKVAGEDRHVMVGTGDFGNFDITDPYIISLQKQDLLIDGEPPKVKEGEK